MGTNKEKSPRPKAASKTPAAAEPSKKPLKKPATPGPASQVHLPADMWERIARKAYELYERRGRMEGCDLQDWYDAESLVMKEIRDNRK